jgi:hypothetical protein
MPADFPRRSTSAAKTGPRLEISPLELKDWINHPSGHGLSNLLTEAKSWEPFAWKGQDLSAPLRALWSAEANGLLTTKPDGRAVDVPVMRVLADVNGWLVAFGKKPVSDNAIFSALSTASKYVAAAVGISLIPDHTNMTVRLVDHFETIANIEKYFEQMRPKLLKLNQQIKHAEAMGFDVAGTLEGREYAERLLSGI